MSEVLSEKLSVLHHGIDSEAKKHASERWEDWRL